MDVRNITYCYLLAWTISLGWACKHTDINNLDLERYEAAIVDFDRENQYQGAPAGAVVFLGGGVIHNWKTLRSDFQGLPSINRGFGEATLREILHYYRRLLDPFQAEVLVMNAGANDIILGAEPQAVLQSFQDFLVQLSISERASRIVYISMIPAPAQWEYWPTFQEANRLIQEVAKENSRIEFVDVSGEFIGSDGQLIQELFMDNGLDLNQVGYARLSSAVAPVVSAMF